MTTMLYYIFKLLCFCLSQLGNDEEEADYVGDVSKLADNNPLV